jgi:hypothetical protein
MSRRACYHLESRFIVSEENLANIREKASPSGKFVWVNSIERLRVCTLVGVPGKYLDLLLPEVTPLPMIAVEIGVKLGSFDGAKRWRITFRSWNKESAEGKTPNFSNPGRGKLSIEEDEPDYTALLARWYSGGIWAASFPRLRYLIDERTDLLGIFMHQQSLGSRFSSVIMARTLGRPEKCGRLSPLFRGVKIWSSSTVLRRPLFTI